MLLTLRGTPFLYYGEELGLRSLDIPNKDAFDPPARRASFLFPWWNRDRARGPMPWQQGPGGGFTTGKPWLPLPPDLDRRNVATESADPGSVLAFYRRLLWLRRATPSLNEGSQELLDVGDADVLAYRRGTPGGSALVLLNFAARSATAQLPDAAPTGAATFAASGRRGAWRTAMSTHGRASGETLTGPVILAPMEALIAYD
jgi:alpha-glucosidase